MNDETNQIVGTETGTESGTGGNPTGAEAGKGTGKPTDKPVEGAKPHEKPAEAEKAPAITPEDIDAKIKAAIGEYAKQQERARTEAEKLAGMNEQERIAYERDSYKTQLEELNQKIARAEMQRTARAMFSEQNLNVPDGIVENLVTDSAETTKANVEAFAKLFSDAVEAAVKARLKGETPKRGTPSSNVTKESILGIKDDMKRMQAIREHIELF